MVSAHEGVTKPDPRIYAILCARNGLDPAACVFIDDSAANVDGARAFGMDAIRFTDAPALAAELAARGAPAVRGRWPPGPGSCHMTARIQTTGAFRR